MSNRVRIVWLAWAVGFLTSASGGLQAAEPPLSAEPQVLMDTFKAGNFADAYDGLSRWTLSPNAAGEELATAFDTAILCLRQLNRVDEIDAYREQVVAAHPQDWRLLAAVAQSYMDVEHYGYMIAGSFHRGQHRGGGKVVNAMDRDRVRALQLYREATEIVEKLDDRQQGVDMLRRQAAALLYGRGHDEAWRLQVLTNLDELPDYEDGWGARGPSRRAPVDQKGNPIYYSVPADWHLAQNDGERWRSILETMVRWDPSRRNEERIARAQFLHSQFGVQTMADFGGWLSRQTDSDGQDKSGTWALHTLDEDETIARLATGVKRFEIPAEHNFIQLYQAVIADQENRAAKEELRSAVHQLAEIFENRRQYPRAAEYWRQAVELAEGKEKDVPRQRLEQISANWGQFEACSMQPAGQGATVEFRFRNGGEVEFTARAVRVEQLLDDVKSYLKSNRQQLDWQQVQIGNLGHRLVQENQEKYLGKEVARWTLDLEPREQHFDRRITVTTPLQKAGAYFVTARMKDGNTSRIILWLADTAIVKKPLEGKIYYYVADAASGRPIAKANVEFFGYRHEASGNNRFQTLTKNFAELTDENGQVLQTIDNESANRYQWITTATTEDGRLAYLGFHHVWRAEHHDQQYREVKTYMITDRPVYRPGQKVQFKFWVRHAQFDQEDTSQFAHQSFKVEIHAPRGEKVLTETLTADAYGGIEGEYELPDEAMLGQYQLVLAGRGGGSFRVEEYKKPEFEVTIEAADKPIALGEKTTAKIKARYYFGAPVVNATVKYKVLRSNYDGAWFPPARWDWLYGSGYWWFASDYQWYPGWNEWGCRRPSPWWFWRRPTPPEVVAESEAQIGPDGTLEVEIDTSLAAMIHPDRNHSYQIQAEVTDESRRTIVGTGQVLVARKPFKVFAWVDRGFYRTGDTISASFAARAIDGQPVAGSGKLKLLKITYGGPSSDEPTETEVRSWDLNTNEQGRAELQLKASEKGQYRLSYTVTDKAGRAIEGGYLFTIVGEGFDGSDFRFNALEIIPDRRQYAAGDKVRLQLNTNHVGSTVLLFSRPSGGVYLPPQVIRIDGKSTIVELDVTRQDMPNFFVEAVTVHGSQVHTVVREIHVPPESRVLSVDVDPSTNAYQPGQHAKVKLRLTDHSGKPFVGSTVVAIYDKSVEYISGGSNVGNIKEFFWKWCRHHQAYSETNLSRRFGNLVGPEEQAMQDLGVFGGTVASDLDAVSSSGTDGFGGVALGLQAAPMSRGQSLMRAAPGAPAVQGIYFAQEAAAAKDGEEPPLAEPTVRTEFADTALWVASLKTDDNGLAVAELDMPENLTTWKIRVWGMGHGTRVGEGAAEVVTRKNLIVRMQAPRFFVERDEVVLSANVHNYLAEAKQVRVRLELDGNQLEAPSVMEETVEVAADGEKRVDWRVKALREGKATVRMLALTDEESDAVEMSFPVYVHGMLKMDAYSGVLRPEQNSAAFEINVPEERRAEQSRLEVRYSPTLAGAMIDALPYLIDYPYGCTEQTLNRFLPAVITQQTLLRMNVDLESIKEKRTNLNAQEIGDDRQRAGAWQRYDTNPVFNEAELSKVVKAGVGRLTDMQLADGGWGWFTGWGERSTPHTTAVVVHGLQIAVENDVALVPGVLERGVAWLEQYQQEQVRRLQNVDKDGQVIDDKKPARHQANNLDALVYMVLVDARVIDPAMRELLYRDCTRLAVYGLAMYGLALHHETERAPDEDLDDKLQMVLRNIRQYLVEDDENQTAYLNLPEDFWWYWYGSEFEAHAYYLKLLSATDPDSEVAPRLVKYLLNNRKHATYWNSTRDTALVVEAFADFLKASGENQPDLKVEVWLDGQKRKEVSINADNLFTFDNKFVLTGGDLKAGRHTVELRKEGQGPLYFNGYVTNFTLEDDIRRAGLELKVNRRYYQLVPLESTVDVSGSRGQAVEQRVEKYNRRPIPNLGTVESGDLVEIELVVEAKNDYEYIVLEDMKAAGFEPVALRSGYTGNELGAYMELRDNRVALFVGRLARGTHSVSYRMRAEIPGRFSALPTKAHAMYAPELKGNSDEIKLKIVD